MEITSADVERADKEVASPSLRAALVWKYLQKSDFSTWDILCFCSEYIASQSLTDTWLQGPAKLLVRLIYANHYENLQKIAAWDNRERKEKRKDAGSPENNSEGTQQVPEEV